MPSFKTNMRFWGTFVHLTYMFRGFYITRDEYSLFKVTKVTKKCVKYRHIKNWVLLQLYLDKKRMKRPPFMTKGQF